MPQQRACWRSKAQARRICSPAAARYFQTLTRLVILLLQFAQCPRIAAQTQQASCIPLNGSTICPAFQEDSISRNLSTFPFLANVRSVQDFDATVSKYLADGFLKVKMEEQYGCNRSTGTSFTFKDKQTHHALQIRYSKTIWCASLVQQSAQSCRGPGDTARTACAETCLAYALSIADILQSPVCSGSNLTENNLASLRQEYALCTMPGDAYAQRRCVDGAAQEEFHCGFEDNDAAYCRYCARLQKQSNGTGGSVEGCCTQANATFCKPYATDGDATRNISQVIVSIGLPTAPPLPTPSAVVRVEHDDKMSAGALAGIIIPSILAVLAIVMSIWLILRRRQRFASRDDRMRTLNALDSRGNESASGEKRVVIRSPTLPLPTADSAMSAPSFRSAMSPVGPIFPPKTPSHDSEQHRLSGFYGGFKDKAMQAEPDEELARESSDDSLVLLDQWSGLQLKAGALVRCLRPYEPALHDELPLRVNDLIRVEALYADRWAKGRVIRNMQDPVAEDMKKAADILTSKVFPLVCVCAAEFDELHDSRPSSSMSISTRRTSMPSVEHTGLEAHPSNEALAMASTGRDSVLSGTLVEASSLEGSIRVPPSLGILRPGSIRRFQLRPRPSGVQQVALPVRTTSSQHGSTRTDPSSGDQSNSAESSPDTSAAQPSVPTAATAPSTGEGGGASTSRFKEQLSTHLRSETKH